MEPDTPFRPFETRLDAQKANQILRDTLDGADDGEIFCERRRSEALVWDDRKLKTASYDASEGFGIRSVAGDVTGYAHSSEMSLSALRRAAEAAGVAAQGSTSTLAGDPKRTNRALYGSHDPISENRPEPKD